MNRKKIIVLIMIVSFSALGSFFVFQKLNFNGKKIIQVENEQNGEKQSELNSEKENDSGISSQSNAENNEETVKAENTANNAEKKGVIKESPQNALKIIDKLVSWGYQKSSGRSIDTIIIHSSYNALGGDQYSVEKLIGEYKEYGVSPHYLIDRKGAIYRLVEDKNIAYHAGESKTPDGRIGVNNFSIGIEMMNTKTDKCTSEQYSSLKYLLAYLKGKYEIKYVLGHDGIAKGRKSDPWNFDWNKIK